MLGEYVSVMGNVSARNASIGVAETHTFVFVALIPTPTLRLYGSANRRDEGVNIMNVGLRFVRNGLIRHSVLRTME